MEYNMYVGSTSGGDLVVAYDLREVLDRIGAAVELSNTMARSTVNV